MGDIGSSWRAQDSGAGECPERPREAAFCDYVYLRDNPALFDRLRREAKADLADKSDGTSVDKSSEKKAS